MNDYINFQKIRCRDKIDSRTVFAYRNEHSCGPSDNKHIIEINKECCSTIYSTKKCFICILLHVIMCCAK